jgi:CBS domain-containing protein
MSKGNVIVKEAMKAKPVTVQPETSVKDAARLMKEHKIGNCIIAKEKPIGIVTESDIVRKIVAEDKQASSITVKNIMSTPVMVIDPYVPLEKAMKKMLKSNIRRLPVVEQGKLIGIITQKDISRISPVLHEISREWDSIGRDEAFYKDQVFSGICEDCGTLSSKLKNVDGRLLCEDCIDALKYE